MTLCRLLGRLFYDIGVFCCIGYLVAVLYPLLAMAGGNIRYVTGKQEARAVLSFKCNLIPIENEYKSWQLTFKNTNSICIK